MYLEDLEDNVETIEFNHEFLNDVTPESIWAMLRYIADGLSYRYHAKHWNHCQINDIDKDNDRIVISYIIDLECPCCDKPIIRYIHRHIWDGEHAKSLIKRQEERLAEWDKLFN